VTNPQAQPNSPGESSKPSDVVAHDAFAAMREPNYRFFAFAFVASSLGLQMLSTAIGWEIYERTDDAFMLGLTGLARALPMIALTLPAGTIAGMDVLRVADGERLRAQLQLTQSRRALAFAVACRAI
jgi:hypothetical protein